MGERGEGERAVPAVVRVVPETMEAATAAALTVEVAEDVVDQRGTVDEAETEAEEGSEPERRVGAAASLGVARGSVQLVETEKRTVEVVEG